MPVCQQPMGVVKSMLYIRIIFLFLSFSAIAKAEPPERFCEIDRQAWCTMSGAYETSVRKIDAFNYLWSFREYYWAEPKVLVLENQACRGAQYSAEISMEDLQELEFDDQIYYARRYSFGSSDMICSLTVLIPTTETSLAIFNYFASNTAVCLNQLPCQPELISSLVGRWDVP